MAFTQLGSLSSWTGLTQAPWSCPVRGSGPLPSLPSCLEDTYGKQRCGGGSPDCVAGVVGREAVMNVDGRRNERSIFAWEERGRRAFPPHTHILNQALSDLRPPGILVKNLSAKNCCQSHFLVISARAEAAPGD